MTERKDGGPAFPELEGFNDYRQMSGNNNDFVAITSGGMSLRDYFAAKALQGIIANPETAASLTDARASGPMESLAVLAECAYAQADAMIRQREK